MWKIQLSGSTFCVHGPEELTSLKCPHYPKQSTGSTQFLFKIPVTYFTDLEQILQKCTWNQKRPQIASAVLRRTTKEKAGGPTAPDIRVHHAATIICTVWRQYKSRYVDQWDRAEGPELNPSLWSVHIRQRRHEHTVE